MKIAFFLRGSGYFRLAEFGIIELLSIDGVEVDIVFFSVDYHNDRLFSQTFREYLIELVEMKPNLNIVILSAKWASDFVRLEKIIDRKLSRRSENLEFFSHPELSKYKIPIERFETISISSKFKNWLKRLIVFSEYRQHSEVQLEKEKQLSNFFSARSYGAVLVSPVVNEVRAEIIGKAAKLASISSFGIISSWDNLTIKGKLRDVFNYYIVWGRGQKEEAITYHGIQPQKILVTGPYPFVYLMQSADLLKRDNRLNQLIWLTSSKFIVGNPEDEWELIEEFTTYCLRIGRVDLIKSLLIRLHPQTPGGSQVFFDWANGRQSNFIQNLAQNQIVCEFIESTSDRRSYLDQLVNSRCAIALATSAAVEGHVTGLPVIAPPGSLSLRAFEGFKHGSLLDIKNNGPVHRSQNWADVINFIDNPHQSIRSESFQEFFGLDMDITSSSLNFARDIIKHATC